MVISLVTHGKWLYIQFADSAGGHRLDTIFEPCTHLAGELYALQRCCRCHINQKLNVITYDIYLGKTYCLPCLIRYVPHFVHESGWFLSLEPFLWRYCSWELQYLAITLPVIADFGKATAEPGEVLAKCWQNLGVVFVVRARVQILMLLDSFCRIIYITDQEQQAGTMLPCVEFDMMFDITQCETL